MSAPLRLGNRDARRVLLHALGLSRPPTGPVDVGGLVQELGFVQLDTIQMVARAHHHILWSRNQNYREPMLDAAMRGERRLFEHFTHDASVLPIETFPYWRRQFTRMETKKRQSAWFGAMPDAATREAIKARIKSEGPLSTHAFDSEREKTGMWQRPPHKLALDYMWYAGELATSHRENFTKYYDLAERVIPTEIHRKAIADDAQVDWLCRSALQRLRFATAGDIMRFWEAADLGEVKDWLQSTARELVDVEVEWADGQVGKLIAFNDIEQHLRDASPPTSRLRILNPFDPLARDRTRLSRLFGFDYRIEIFVPAAKRQWGYYVFPIIESDRFIGRIELRADRKRQRLDVLQFWSEPGTQWTPSRWRKLDTEIERLCRFSGATNTTWNNAASASRRNP